MTSESGKRPRNWLWVAGVSAVAGLSMCICTFVALVVTPDSENVQQQSERIVKTHTIETASANEVRLMEGEDCTQDVVGVSSAEVPQAFNMKESSGFTNDEARSMLLRNVPSGVVLKIFDSPDGRTDDDWTEIVIKKDIEEYCIGSLEATYEDELVRMVYQRHNGLDGKASRLELHDREVAMIASSTPNEPEEPIEVSALTQTPQPEPTDVSAPTQTSQPEPTDTAAPTAYATATSTELATEAPVVMPPGVDSGPTSLPTSSPEPIESYSLFDGSVSGVMVYHSGSSDTSYSFVFKFLGTATYPCFVGPSGVADLVQYADGTTEWWDGAFLTTSGWYYTRDDDPAFANPEWRRYECPF